MNGGEIQIGQLVRVADITGKIKLFYVEELCGSNIASGKRVNTDFSFSKYDKEHPLKKQYIMTGDVVEIINPFPAAFTESLRTLHFWVDTVLEDFGEIRDINYNVLLRAVRFENGSYGIIQNRLYPDGSGIDLAYDHMNVFEDLSYKELVSKWEIKKNNHNTRRENENEN